MKLKKQHKINTKYRLLSISALAVLLIAVGVIYYLEKTHTTDFIKNPFYHQSQAEINREKADKATRNDPTTKNKNDIPTPVAGVDPNKSTSQVPVTPEASISITQLVQNNGQVTYEAMQSGLPDKGTCTATFSNTTARPVVNSSNAINNTCGPVNISENEFDQLGNWTLTVRYFADSQQVVTTKDIVIK